MHTPMRLPDFRKFSFLTSPDFPIGCSSSFAHTLTQFFNLNTSSGVILQAFQFVDHSNLTTSPLERISGSNRKSSIRPGNPCRDSSNDAVPSLCFFFIPLLTSFFTFLCSTAFVQNALCFDLLAFVDLRISRFGHEDRTSELRKLSLWNKRTSR